MQAGRPITVGEDNFRYCLHGCGVAAVSRSPWHTTRQAILIASPSYSLRARLPSPQARSSRGVALQGVSTVSHVASSMPVKMDQEYLRTQRTLHIKGQGRWPRAPARGPSASSAAAGSSSYMAFALFAVTGFKLVIVIFASIVWSQTLVQEFELAPASLWCS